MTFKSLIYGIHLLLIWLYCYLNREDRCKWSCYGQWGITQLVQVTSIQVSTDSPQTCTSCLFCFFSNRQETSASTAGSMIIASLPWTISEQHWMASATKLGTRNWLPCYCYHRKVNGPATLFVRKKNKKASSPLTESRSYENLSCKGIQWEHSL